MITVAVLAIGAGLLVREVGTYQDAGRRARAVAAVAEVLDQELEAGRACPDRACLDAWATRSATTAAARPESLEWARPHLERTLGPGPDGTLELRVTAEIPDLVPPRTLVTLVEARR